ncbi:MAG: glutathione S-transferase family protein [Alphaproteobacteria bacterium]|nr:glutathione S-transferase family protein [Alphaproteobacteria bacterium]
MTSLSIYGVAASRTFRVLWVAHELDLKFKHILIGFGGTETLDSPEYLAINPNGKIPAIRDGDFTLWESLAITLYLAKKHSKRFYPQSLKGEALCWQWSMFALSELDKPIIAWALNDHVLPPAKRNTKLAKAALEEMQRPFKVLDQTVARTPYLLGRQFTVADLNVASVLFRARKMMLHDYPALADWLNRCYARPSAIAAVKMRE